MGIGINFGILKKSKKIKKYFDVDDKFFSENSDIFEDLEEYDLPKTESGAIDIYQHIYNLISKYYPLLEKGLKKVIIRTFENVSKEDRPFICISYHGGRTNEFGIRTENVYFEVYAENLEQGLEIKDILINLLNRRVFKGIKSKLERDFGFDVSKKTGLVRLIFDFHFVFKDMKF